MSASLRLPLGKLQFYWRTTPAPNVPPNPVPDFVDFEFSFLEEHQLIIQTRNPQTWQYLETIYREHFNVGYLQEGHALAPAYGGDFIECIQQALSTHHPQARRILEIGAGGCYILKQLKAKGYEVAAVDPSPIARRKGEEFSIEVVPEFYPATQAIRRSDVVIHYDVLEHVPDPAGFLRHHLDNLNPGGLIVVAVPDCSPYIERGDISMLIHEHLNYFDEESLQWVIEAAGFNVLQILRAGYGGVLYGIARAASPRAVRHPPAGTAKFERWMARVQWLQTRVDRFIAAATAPERTLGCYVPLRASPYLSMRGLASGFRFFDDDPGVRGRYFDGFPVAVENTADLLARPVSHLLILSFAFGQKIRDRINARSPEHGMTILCLSDFDAEMKLDVA